MAEKRLKRPRAGGAFSSVAGLSVVDDDELAAKPADISGFYFEARVVGRPFAS